MSPVFKMGEEATFGAGTPGLGGVTPTLGDCAPTGVAGVPDLGNNVDGRGNGFEWDIEIG